MSAIGLLFASARDRTARDAAGAGDEPAQHHGRVRCRLDARPRRDPDLPRGVDRDRFAALVLRCGRPRPALAHDGIRARLRRPADLLRTVHVAGLDRRSGSIGPNASTARSRSSWRRSGSSGRRRPCSWSRARRATRRRPRRAASRWRSTGSMWSRARSGSAVSSACSCSGRRRRPRPGSPVLTVVVPRFSNVALVSVALLLGSGIWAAILNLPVLSALWTTSYGQVILVKAAILALAMLVASVNLLRTKPRLAAAGATPRARPVRGKAPAPRASRPRRSS